jgi:hypothetical protein
MRRPPRRQPAAEQHRQQQPRGNSNGSVVREPEAVRIRLLGGFHLWVGHRVIEEGRWRLRKAKSLVKLLAVAPGHRLHREQVMETLWPVLEPHSASNNLHQILHAARRTFEPSASQPLRRPRHQPREAHPDTAQGIHRGKLGSGGQRARAPVPVGRRAGHGAGCWRRPSCLSGATRAPSPARGGAGGREPRREP